jgi:hypothetical protein
MPITDKPSTAFDPTIQVENHQSPLALPFADGGKLLSLGHSRLRQTRSSRSCANPREFGRAEVEPIDYGGRC